MSSVIIWVDWDVRDKIKQLSAKQGISMKDFVSQIVNKEYDRRITK